MPPALDKTLEKDHRIQISSPVLSRDVDSTKDMDTQSKPVGENYTRLRFNLSSLTALDFSSVKSLLELTEMPLQSMFNSSASYKIDLQPSLGASLGSVSMDKSGPDCPSPNEDSTASKKDHQSLTKTLPCLLYFQKVSKPLSSERSSGNMTRNQGNALRPEWHVVSRRAMQEKVDAQRTRLASQLHTLTSRTNRAKRRLHAVLGENVLQTINKKFEEFKGKFSTIATKTEPDPRSPAHNRCANASGIHEEEGDFLPENFSQQASSTFSGPAVCQGGGTLSRTSAESAAHQKCTEFSTVWTGGTLQSTAEFGLRCY
ncbi:hypothetical protein Baya_14407 [Bagarius yarrelli]|uniref:Uncharacterized protein n=1 Tax=Bagarius yarrelli TaxID=175774 RepID=A0A556V8J0_BAGYA|nr:hypothetical protein Baya_14407 [Bagarius yarrelli]